MESIGCFDCQVVKKEGIGGYGRVEEGNEE
jgi:hypothetical protein